MIALCALSDAVLIALGVAGFGTLTARLPWAEPVLRLGGAAFLAVYGLGALRRAWRGGAALDPAQAARQPLGRVLLTCLALTWLNPHVWLDTVVLLGSVAATMGPARWSFGAGAMAASVLFFSALGMGARALAPVLARPAVWRGIEGGIGLLMCALALALLRG